MKNIQNKTTKQDRLEYKEDECCGAIGRSDLDSELATSKY